MDDELREDLIAIDRALGEVPLPPTLERRVFADERARSPWPWMLAAVGVAVSVLVLAWLWPSTPAADPSPITHADSPPVDTVETPSPSAPTPPRTRWAGRLQIDDGCQVTGDAPLGVPQGCQLTLADPVLRVDVLDEASIRPARRGVGIDAGLVMVSVEHIDDPEDPVRVEVVGGTIEVTGTRFLVVQGPERGYVHLIEGSIRFVPEHGEVVDVRVGEPLHWNREGIEQPATPPEPTPASVDPPRTRPRVPAEEATPDLDALLDEVAALRRGGRYREAARLLRRTRSKSRDPQTQEILSYEEGTLRERYQVPAAACAHWRGHLARFAEGRYDEAIGRRLADLSCPPALDLDRE